jgi:hypothetical protein
MVSHENDANGPFSRLVQALCDNQIVNDPGSRKNLKRKLLDLEQKLKKMQVLSNEWCETKIKILVFRQNLAIIQAILQAKTQEDEQNKQYLIHKFNVLKKNLSSVWYIFYLIFI